MQAKFIISREVVAPDALGGKISDVLSRGSSDLAGQFNGGELKIGVSKYAMMRKMPSLLIAGGRGSISDLLGGVPAGNVITISDDYKQLKFLVVDVLRKKQKLGKNKTIVQLRPTDCGYSNDGPGSYRVASSDLVANPTNGLPRGKKITVGELKALVEWMFENVVQEV